MRQWKSHPVLAVAAAAALMAAAPVLAQTGVGREAAEPQANQPPADAPAANQSAPTLEVPPRFSPPPPASTSGSESTDDASSQDANGGSTTDTSPPISEKRPYLGLSVQFIRSDATPGREVRGLEVVGVDADSPAERAGLHARGTMTKVGATGATAGALMPPLDLLVMPLLEKSGQLGAPGDLIIAIDDQRIESEVDLETVLDASKPGVTVYFTVVRTIQDGSHETLKIPVKLGDPNPAVANADPSVSNSHPNSTRESGQTHGP